MATLHSAEVSTARGHLERAKGKEQMFTLGSQNKSWNKTQSCLWLWDTLKVPKQQLWWQRGGKGGWWWWWSNFCWDKNADFSLAHRNKWLDSMSGWITTPPSWLNNTYLTVVKYAECSYKTLHLSTGRKGGRNNPQTADKIRRRGYEQGTEF